MTVSKTVGLGSNPSRPAICLRAAVGETEPTQNRLRRYIVSSSLTAGTICPCNRIGIDMRLRTVVLWVRLPSWAHMGP